MDRIQISISKSLHEGQDLNPYGLDSNISFRRFQEGLLEVVDLNPYGLNSNLDSKKVFLDNRI